MTPFRNEWKYFCTDGEADLICSRMARVLTQDSHAGPDGTYSIHSLYFDDLYDACARGNESGDGIRSKYRIRCYGAQHGSLHLERKDKMYGRGRKLSCPLTSVTYDALLRGDAGALLWRDTAPLLKSFAALMMTRHFTPKVIIDYERTAFVEPITNVRVTIDRSISAAEDTGAFLSGSYVRYPLQSLRQNVLEVKFDDILPGYIKQLIESTRVQQTTFSKYYLGRKVLEGVYR